MKHHHWASGGSNARSSPIEEAGAAGAGAMSSEGAAGAGGATIGTASTGVAMCSTGTGVEATVAVEVTTAAVAGIGNGSISMPLFALVALFSYSDGNSSSSSLCQLLSTRALVVECFRKKLNINAKAITTRTTPITIPMTIIRRLVSNRDELLALFVVVGPVVALLALVVSVADVWVWIRLEVLLVLFELVIEARRDFAR